MSVDPELLSALGAALSSLRDEPQCPVPVNAIRALVPIARPGMRARIDLDASRIIGAPLVTVSSGTAGEGLFAKLTPRQKQVAALLIDGKSNKQIARDLAISPATVKDHVHAIFERLGLPSRGAVIAAAHSGSSHNGKSF